MSRFLGFILVFLSICTIVLKPQSEEEEQLGLFRLELYLGFDNVPQDNVDSFNIEAQGAVWECPQDSPYNWKFFNVIR